MFYIIAKDVGYLSVKDFNIFANQIIKIHKLLNIYI